jgi:pimeloyl-ACP methyl ester carboxylesterase
MNVNFERVGNGETFVFCLHGWGSELAVYKKTAAVLAEKYTVISVDLPGFGKSQEPPEAWNVENYSKWFADFVKSFNCENVILFGHSFGGRVIIKLFSLKYSFNIKKVVLIDSAGIKPKKKLKTKVKESFAKFAKIFLSEKQIQNLKNKTGSADYRNASPLMKQVLVKTVNEDLSQHLPLIKAPTLLFWGENDTATPLSDALLMEKLIPNAGIVKVKGGHFSFLEQPNIFEKAIRSFLEI